MLALSDASVLLRVGARTGYSALGLQIAPVLASVPLSEVRMVEKACDLHPYTRYRVRCLGSTNGLFMIFAIPNGTEFQLTEFFEELKGLGLVNDYKILHATAEPCYRNPDLRIYDAWSDSWKFKTEKWVQSLDREDREDLQQFAPSTLTKLDIRDLKLLRLLTQDARKPQKLLSKELRVPEYHVSRRLKFIFENGIVPSCEVFLGRKLFRNAPGALFDVSCDPATTRAIVTGLKTLPFQASMFPTSEGFLLFAGLPTPLFTEIGTAILDRSRASNLMWTDYDTSMRYHFDESPYVEQTGQWKADRDFVINETLSSLREAK
jgi:DNA-binding Lrp family transcriptional regulator